MTGFLLGSADSVRADGGTVRFSEVRGAYRLTVFTQPTPLRAGPVDVSVLVQSPATGEPVSDVRVTVRFRPEDRSRPSLSIPATKANATNKLLYAASLELPSPGQWNVEVIVDGPAGSAVGAFPLEAAAATASWWDVIFWIAWPVVPVVLFAWHQVRVRAYRSRPIHETDGTDKTDETGGRSRV
jgi:hypothetical protein